MMMNNKPAGKSAAEGREMEMDRVVEPEYASVSGTAILALILAPLGLLALKAIYFHMFGLPVPILLIIPIISLAIALAAVRGIRHSEGTRVGIKLAITAATLSALIFVGATAYHGHQIYQQQSRLNDLMTLAQRDTELIFTGRYDTIYNRMLLNNPALATRQPLADWTAHLDELLYSGGDYYGSRLEAVRMFNMRLNEEDPTAPEELLAVVVRRLVFRHGAADLIFNYMHHRDQWQLDRKSVV